MGGKRWEIEKRRRAEKGRKGKEGENSYVPKTGTTVTTVIPRYRILYDSNAK